MKTNYLIFTLILLSVFISCQSPEIADGSERNFRQLRMKKNKQMTEIEVFKTDTLKNTSPVGKAESIIAYYKKTNSSTSLFLRNLAESNEVLIHTFTEKPIDVIWDTSKKTVSIIGQNGVFKKSYLNPESEAEQIATELPAQFKGAYQVAWIDNSSGNI